MLDISLCSYNLGIMKIKVIGVLAALAHESRLDIFRELVQAAPDGLAAGAIASKLDIPAPTCSFHLKELRNADVVVSERQGRSIVYRANFSFLQSSLNYLLEDCCGGVAGRLVGPSESDTA